METRDPFFVLNEQLVREVREYLEQERKLRMKHQERIDVLLAEMEAFVEKKKPPS